MGFIQMFKRRQILCIKHLIVQLMRTIIKSLDY